VLTAVRRDVATRSALSALEALVSGPTRGELGAGLSSVLSPGDVDLSLVSVRGAVVTVPLSGRPGGVTERADALLGYAQVVLTLTRLGAVDGVVFELEGEPLTVPRADGSLGAGELRAADYASLLAR
jgi:spore germination protein GerM